MKMFFLFSFLCGTIIEVFYAWEYLCTVYKQTLFKVLYKGKQEVSVDLYHHIEHPAREIVMYILFHTFQCMH